MKGQPAIPRARSIHWNTPAWLLDAFRQAVGGPIDLDPCSNQYSIVNAAVRYELPQTDGLVASWDYPTIWVNPPFGKGIIDWVNCCNAASMMHGSQVGLIVPASTETDFFQGILSSAAAVCFLDRRVRFNPNPLTPARADRPTKGHAVAYWGSRATSFVRYFGPFGYVVAGGWRALEPTLQ